MLLAFLAYALVPYLGILFCPGAIVVGSVNLLRRTRSTQSVEAISRTAAAAGILAGFLILCAQLFLWWLLYKAPEWTLGQ